MHQISNFIYADDALLFMDIPTKHLPNPYLDIPYILIKNFITAAECNDIVRSIVISKDAIDAQLRGGALNNTIRKTDIYTLNNHQKILYENRFDEFRGEIERFFSCSLTSSTDVQALGYEHGDFYLRHSDDSSELRNKHGETVGFKCVAPTRKLTTVLFTTSHTSTEVVEGCFSGGELLFNYLMDEEGHTITLRPQAGDMVVFLSNPYFSHEVLPITDGFRLTLVQWHNALL